jgi:hypothetical protein
MTRLPNLEVHRRFFSSLMLKNLLSSARVLSIRSAADLNRTLFCRAPTVLSLYCACNVNEFITNRQGANCYLEQGGSGYQSAPFTIKKHPHFLEFLLFNGSQTERCAHYMVSLCYGVSIGRGSRCDWNNSSFLGQSGGSSL